MQSPPSVKLEFVLGKEKGWSLLRYPFQPQAGEIDPESKSSFVSVLHAKRARGKGIVSPSALLSCKGKHRGAGVLSCRGETITCKPLEVFALMNTAVFAVPGTGTEVCLSGDESDGPTHSIQEYYATTERNSDQNFVIDQVKILNLLDGGTLTVKTSSLEYALSVGDKVLLQSNLSGKLEVVLAVVVQLFEESLLCACSTPVDVQEDSSFVEIHGSGKRVSGVFSIRVSKRNLPLKVLPVSKFILSFLVYEFFKNRSALCLHTDWCGGPIGCLHDRRCRHRESAET